MKYVVAVSGGVDSVVLLDMLAKSSEHELIVAHFDHGIRPDSDADARFVGELAQSYSLPFETARKELGANASEEEARRHRYNFLRKVAKKYKATIATAHHIEDVYETIAINTIRGTGWRGLAVFGSKEIARPVLNKTKQNIYDYALQNKLEWAEDETNNTDVYLRNRVRKSLGALDEATLAKLKDIWQQQLRLLEQIDGELDSMQPVANRYFYTMIDEASAQECLRWWLHQSGKSLTRPQRNRLLLAIKTLRPGSTFEAGESVAVSLGKRDFTVKTL